MGGAIVVDLCTRHHLRGTVLISSATGFSQVMSHPYTGRPWNN
jgi:hypothetical protein